MLKRCNNIWHGCQKGVRNVSKISEINIENMSYTRQDTYVKNRYYFFLERCQTDMIMSNENRRMPKRSEIDIENMSKTY